MISWREIGRGIYRRFLPAAVATKIVLGLPVWIVTHFVPLPTMVVTVASLVLGYSVVLGLLRTRLRSDANIDGRRSIVAGIASLGLIVAGAATLPIGSASLFDGFVRLAALNFGSGALVTLGIFFPWIGARRADISAADAVAELGSPIPSNVRARAAVPTPVDRA